MCGIIGMVIPSGLQQVHLDYFTDMLQRCQARGTHATGAYNDMMQYVKAPIRAVDFVKTDQYKAWLAGNIGKTWIIGHTRLWSRGPPEFNENNHPVMLPGQEKKAMVIHNGFFDSPAYDKDRNKSDTHIPLWITENDDINNKEAMLAALNKIYTVSSGSFVFILGTPDVLGFCKSHTRPLVFYTKGKNVAFASTDEILGRKSSHEMSVSQSLVFVKSTGKWTKADLAPASAPIVEYTPQTSAEIDQNGRVKVSVPNFVMRDSPAKQYSTTTVDSPDSLRERLDQLTELEEFTCFGCGAVLFWECVTKVQNARVFYKCPNAECKNHTNEGWRSLKSLRINYIEHKRKNKKEKKKVETEHYESKRNDPKSWFEDDANPCIDRSFVALDGFTNYGYCLEKERYVNVDEDCSKCESGGNKNEQPKKSNA